MERCKHTHTHTQSHPSQGKFVNSRRKRITKLKLHLDVSPVYSLWNPLQPSLFSRGLWKKFCKFKRWSFEKLRPLNHVGFLPGDLCYLVLYFGVQGKKKALLDHKIVENANSMACNTEITASWICWLSSDSWRCYDSFDLESFHKEGALGIVQVFSCCRRFAKQHLA